MSTSPENYHTWSPSELADYLQEHNLGQYAEVIMEHKITGENAPRLTDSDLKEMGISTVGDRLQFKKALSELQVTHRKNKREQVLWEGEEVLWFSCWQQLWGTCCGCCPADPSKYTLTGTHLVIKTVDPCRVACIRCCCMNSYRVDNLDLTHVTDADVQGVPAPCVQQICCCGKAQDHIHIKTTSDGEKVLVLHKGEGEPVSRKILNQVEEAQHLERD